jgi:hypothetical protein
MNRQLRARAAQEFRAPRPTRFAVWLLRRFGRAYLRFAHGVRETRLLNPAVLHDCYLAFQRGATRLLVLFRHVDVADGPLIMNALAGELDKYDRGVRRHREGLPRRPHSQFLYGKDVLDWAGPGARWVFPRLGGIPVVNTRLDRRSHAAIRDTILNGEHPLALAPEGQVTYQMFHVSELTAGTGTMAHWIERDLVSLARRHEDEGERERPGILLLPVAIGYQYGNDHPRLIESILGRLETALGIRLASADSIRERLLFATDTVLDVVEAAYTAAYPAVFRHHDEHESQTSRIARLCDRILRCAELGEIRKRESSILRRLFSLRYRVFDIRYRVDVDPRNLDSVQRSWADFRTLAAATVDRHAQIVDVLMYLRPEYVADSPTSLRLVEYALNLLDITNRMAGGNIDSRYSPSGKQARVLMGTPIDAAAAFRNAEQTSKQAIQGLNEDVYRAFQSLSADLERRMSVETRTDSS